MIAPHRSRIVQAVRLIEHEMKRLWLEVRPYRTAEKPVQLREIRVLRTGGIREKQNRMTTLYGKRVVVNFPLPHRACWRHTAAPMRFASSMSCATPQKTPHRSAAVKTRPPCRDRCGRERRSGFSCERQRSQSSRGLDWQRWLSSLGMEPQRVPPCNIIAARADASKPRERIVCTL